MYSSNVYSSNLTITSSNANPSLVIKNQNDKNLLETYFNNNPAFIISSNGNIAINKEDEGLVEKVEIVGNMMIKGHIYPEDDITYDLGKDTNKIKNLYSSNVYSSNLTITSSNANPSLIIQNQNDKNLLETYFNNNPAFIISSNGNIAINKEDEGLIEKLELLGNFKIKGHIYPEDDISYDLGKNTNKLKNLYSSNVYSSNLTITSSNANWTTRRDGTQRKT